MRILQVKLLMITASFLPLTCGTKQAHLDQNWYPKQASQLKAQISGLTQQASSKFDANLDPQAIKAIIVPHAGYNYSGVVASSVYRLCNPKVNKFIILAPAHAGTFTGIALPDFEGYQTPLGKILVDIKTCTKLAQNKLFHKNGAIYHQEHSLEIQLPLMQTFFGPNLSIIPLLVGHLSCEQAGQVALELKKIITPDTLVIISSDFVHYGKQFNFMPFKTQIEAHLKELNAQAIELIESYNCQGFANFVTRTGATICGVNPLKILLCLLEKNLLGRVEPRLIAYDTSGKQTNNQNHSVSYIGMLFTQEKLAQRKFTDRLTQLEKTELYQLAQNTLHNLFQPKNQLKLNYPFKSLGLKQNYGAFTTIEQNTLTGHKLRGCIGRITTNRPVYETVVQTTIDAALHDSRFSPVSAPELANLSLKLAILSPSTPIKNYREIKLGAHGIILHNDGRSALFLPEVATEFHWTLPQTLTELSKKAGLTSNAWQDPNTKFEVFSTISI